MHRGFLEAGRVWERIGAATGRADVAAHGAELLEAAPVLYTALHASLNRTVHTLASGGRCWASAVDRTPSLLQRKNLA